VSYLRDDTPGRLAFVSEAEIRVGNFGPERVSEPTLLSVSVSHTDLRRDVSSVLHRPTCRAQLVSYLRDDTHGRLAFVSEAEIRAGNFGLERTLQ
jgi:hypothetical protein